MPHNYFEFVKQAEQQLEAARAAMPRDFVQAIEAAGWASYLRDKYDVAQLVKHVTEMFRDGDFLSQLHATADKVREQQPRVGRPPKPLQAG